MTKPAAHIKHTTGRQKLVSIVPTIAQHVNRLACTLLAVAQSATVAQTPNKQRQAAPKEPALSHSKFPVAGIGSAWLRAGWPKWQHPAHDCLRV